MVTNYFPSSAITHHSTLHRGSLHPGLEWHLETVEGGLFNAALRNVVVIIIIIIVCAESSY